jgi:uncharacterized membrane protein
MEKDRTAAFSDAVIAIIMTIMVLELRPPHEPTWAALMALWPKIASYVLSFGYLAIYWNNHHHMMHTVERVNGAILWANMHLLFWLSLVPFSTAWMGETHSAALPTAVYGVSLLLPAIAYYTLQTIIVRAHGPDSVLARALRHDLKGKLSPLAYLAAIGLSFVTPRIAQAIYVLVALVWLVPDRRIERAIAAIGPASAPPSI